MTDVEFTSIQELYDKIKDEDSASYDAFRKKLKRLAEGNVTSTNRLYRSFGKKPKSKTPVREFVAYDGEGENNRYILLANSLGEYIYNREDGLSTEECLAFLATTYDVPVKRVFFSFGYDVNFIIKDFDRTQLDALLSGEKVDYRGYEVWWIPGKMLKVNNLTYYDVFSFFTTSFINAIGQHLGSEYVSERLTEGKTARGTFETWDIEKIIDYNAEELELLVKLMEKLRDDFNQVGVNLQEWYGPGAVAKYWLKERGISPHEKLTVGVIKALHSAYYGGRFEQMVIGKVNNVFEYDLRSAYPSAMVDMPNFTSWKSVPRGEFVDNRYSIWHITFDLRYHHRKYHNRKFRNSPYAHTFMPLPVRENSGHLCFPMMGKGWYWYDEVKVMLDWFPDAKVTFHGGYIAKTEGKPFAWVRGVYNERQRLKTEGNQAQFALKVGLNSLYGKTAQRVGTAPFFSLAWAGYITSTTRARLARVGYEVGSQNVLGFATDALFTTKETVVPLSSALGDWKQSTFKTGYFFQSGIYRMVAEDGKITDRYRGSPLRRGIDDIIGQLEQHPFDRPHVKVGRFVSNNLANRAPKVYGPVRLQFIQAKQELALDSSVKRHYHFPREKDRVNFGRLLTHSIDSTPKVFAGDDVWWLTDEWLYNESQINKIESKSPPMTDPGTMRLLSEAEQASVEAGYDTVSKLENLPTVEDPNDVSET